jgi:hypothetical protein
MAETLLRADMQQLRETGAFWATSTYILRPGQLGIDVTNNIIKAGDGLHTWKNLPKLNDFILEAGDNVTIDVVGNRHIINASGDGSGGGGGGIGCCGVDRIDSGVVLGA